ncbi:PP2C family protein-serine/threonine phosphatase [uncultured Treponema sp.]|uniref:PP2C family protein-serine/threonine phosphatase n=1 Tax=uncultured Treponema sp. TaxID=162155 RepID=UPI0025D9B23A|nr:PP2C family protein-serine/threonine phosphatase [uncultured Treponema sp.]
MRRRRLPVITKKIVVAIVVAGLLLCSILFSASYAAFSRQFRRQYDFSIKAIAAAARATLNPDDFSGYLESKKTDDRYNATHDILQDFVDKFELNLLYVSFVDAPDYKHITYIYNVVANNSKWKEFPLGHEEDYIEPNYNSTAKRVFEKGETIVRHTMKTRNGSHITAMLPVYDSDGKIVAVIGAQKSIQEFVDARYSFINLVILVEVVFGFIFVLLFCSYFNLKFIKPLVLITRETDHFASWGGKPSDRLLSVKNRDEIGILAHSLHQMEYDVCRNIDELTKMTAEKERISTELSVATKIQSDMLPKEYPPFPERKDFDLFATMDPAKEVGGDLYDYILLDEDHLMLVVGDVSGKGVPAALFMGKCKSLLDFQASHTLSPAEIFEVANEQLCKGNDSGLFVTCWLGILTFSTGELRFVNAGHPSPVLFHNGEFSYIKTKPNFVLGGMEGIHFTEHSMTLEKGDRLFVYSDGVNEATDSNEQLFGEERLISAMQGTEKFDAPETLKKLREKIDAFVGEAEQFDDITMLQFIWKTE